MKTMWDRSNAPSASSSRMARSARSLVVLRDSRPTNTRIGAFASPPMTAVISSGVSAMLTNRRPSRPMSAESTALRGPPETNSEVGAWEWMTSTASPAPSALWKTAWMPR